MEAASPASPSSGERTLLAVLLLLCAVAWIEPRGSGLAEPDETRYAEIPREMLAAGDLVVPRLNGLPYFEKPPLLYWANAAAFRLFGLTPYAARLPTRLAGLGTLLLLVLAVARERGRAAGLSAGVFWMASPIGFIASRTNLTDGLLTFFFSATVLAGRAAISRRSRSQGWIGMAAWTGVAAAGAFLTKGLIGLALPGAILLVWALATRKGAHLLALIFSPALPAFLALSLPWLLVAEHRHPGFLQFFFIHEHFQRFATDVARRPGPIYYFVPVFVVGFLPGLAFFCSGAARTRRMADPDGFFYLTWFWIVFVFFSISRSKLPPYLFPAIPAAAALAQRAVGNRRPLWIVHAILATAFSSALLFLPALRTPVAQLRLAAIMAPALSALILLSWAAVLFAARSSALALAAVAVGWAAFLGAAVIGWPRIPQARMTAELAAAAREEAATRQAPIVGYHAYLNGVSWELAAPIPVAGYRGELEPEFEKNRQTREALIWSEDRFWKTWRTQPVVALIRLKDVVALMTVQPPARVVRWKGKYAVVANWEK
ncbi:MAG: phospholipid carrier-dependent glycosyltransferase [Acidobacteriota bacterium]